MSADLRRSGVLVLSTIAVVIALGIMPGASRAAATCAQTLTPGDSTVSITVGGIARDAVLHVPPGLPARKHVPLVLALHGYGGSGAQMESYSGLSAVADRNGFLVAYPSSDGLYWNSKAAIGLPNDVAFLSGLIADLETSSCVDPTRVFATGVSNGGSMVALAACDLSRQIVAIASVAGDYAGQPACTPAKPVSVLEIHGTADQVVPYLGRGPGHRGSVPAFVEGWARRDRCQPSAVASRVATRTTSYRWRGCRTGAVVEQIKILHGTHQWPDATPPDPGPPATICAACAVWSFFSSLPARRASGTVSPGSGSGGVGLGP
jgi:polyhydroxybutyrate depolymerase